MALVPSSSEPAPPPPAPVARTRWGLYVRLALAIVCLGISIWFTRETVEGLQTRRELRTELAEISHVRYDLLNADVWVKKLTPILDANIDALDFTPSKN